MTQTHKVATDALETLGTLIPANSGRDAIHLAVEPVVAGEALVPGQRIKLIGNEAFSANDADAIGIVDPFLKLRVMPDDRFWLVVLPRTITSLRHVWSHPAFPEELAFHADADEHYVVPDKTASEQWIRDWIKGADCPDYEELMAAAVGGGNQWSDEYLHFNGVDAHGEIPAEFWVHAEIVTGRKITTRPTYFSCSC